MDFDEWLEGSEKVHTDKYFAALCRSIVGQQLSGKAAAAIYKKFLTLFKSNEENLTPSAVLKLPDQKLRDVGLSWSKVSYIKDLSKKVKENEVNLVDLDELDDSSIIERLTIIKGIGTWTAEMFLMFTLKRQNIFSFKDLGLKKGLEKIYKIENPTQPQIEKIIKKWHPYKTFGSIALWQSLEK